MKILKIIGIGLVAILLLAVVFTVFQSPQSHLARSVVINAPDSVIFEYVNNYQKFNAWSPWAKLDANTQYMYDGPTAGVGARMSWVSKHPDVGTGAQWIVESEPYKRVKSGMQFGDFEGEFFAQVDIEPAEGGHRVTWHYYGDVSTASAAGAFMGKFFGLFMDGMLGPQYEDGLKNLKAVAESGQ
ncbi:MAG: SRPBCC family protein [Cyclobacteriaceae bacterium]|jgi:hypothetical protein|nr:SRPBCC family protein [Cyclobacteriaceae bacterium]